MTGSGSRMGGEPLTEAGYEGRRLKGEEGRKVDSREVLTRPREKHFIFDLARNLERMMLLTESILVAM